MELRITPDGAYEITLAAATVTRLHELAEAFARQSGVSVALGETLVHAVDRLHAEVCQAAPAPTSGIIGGTPRPLIVQTDDPPSWR